MALSSMLSPAQRIGKMKGEILRHAQPREVLGMISETKPMPKNRGETIVFRRWLPKNATTASPNTFFVDGTGDRGNAYAQEHQVTEGVTPQSETLAPQDIEVSLNEYAVLFGYTKRTADLYEDDVPMAMKQQTGERIALVREMVRFGNIKGCTNKFYGGTGTTRATVNGKLTLKLLRKVTKTLDIQHADQVTSILSASANYGTSPIEASFFVYIHTDLKPDVRDIPGFVPKSKYGSMKTASPYEFGSVEEFRFIASPELVSVQDSGAAVGALGLESTSGVNIDVYQAVVCGRNAYGDVALRGAKSLEVYNLKPDQIDKNDPTGQRGYCGASTYFAHVILNDFWMAVIEVGASELTD